jgi:hypothetical protein
MNISITDVAELAALAILIAAYVKVHKKSKPAAQPQSQTK